MATIPFGSFHYMANSVLEYKNQRNSRGTTYNREKKKRTKIAGIHTYILCLVLHTYLKEEEKERKKRSTDIGKRNKNKLQIDERFIDVTKYVHPDGKHLHRQTLTASIYIRFTGRAQKKQNSNSVDTWFFIISISNKTDSDLIRISFFFSLLFFFCSRCSYFIHFHFRGFSFGVYLFFFFVLSCIHRYESQHHQQSVTQQQSVYIRHFKFQALKMTMNFPRHTK